MTVLLWGLSCVGPKSLSGKGSPVTAAALRPLISCVSVPVRYGIVFLCSHSGKQGEKPDHYRVLLSLLEEHAEIRKEVQHGAWADRVCRQGRTRVVQGLEQKKAVTWGQEKVMAVISLKLACDPPSVWTRVGTYKTCHFVPQNVEAYSLVCEASNKVLHKSRPHSEFL